jgi:hypothetical protein
LVVATDAAAIIRVAARVRELAAGYEPPDFAHVPDPDAAIFLCAVDHRTGYRSAHRVEGRGSFAGSALMWELGLLAARRRAGSLTAPALVDVDAEAVGEAFRTGGETIADPDRRAALWRDLAQGLLDAYGGAAAKLLAACADRLGGGGGLLARLGRFEAYADPLAKKSFLFAKICERRGWLEVSDPDRWEVCADNVLMRLALRCGLVASGGLDTVRVATRDAFKRVALDAGVSPPILDDLLWERGRDDPDLLGTAGGDLGEPERVPGRTWY